MLRINLLGHEPSRPKRRRAVPELTLGGSESVGFMLAVVGTLVLLGAAYWFQSSRLSRLRARLAVVEAERTELAETAAQVKDVQGRTATIKQKLRVIVDLKRSQTGPLLLLDQISRSLPDSLWLSQLEAQQGEIAITGSALSNVAITDFVRNLRLSPYFSVAEGGLRFTEDTGDAFRFQVNARFLPQARREASSSADGSASASGKPSG
ncbi:MAG: PilN domain-containing protein [Acidobacteriota bacterium]